MASILTRTPKHQLNNTTLLSSSQKERIAQGKKQVANIAPSNISQAKTGQDKLHDSFLNHLLSLVDSASLDGFFSVICPDDRNSPRPKIIKEKSPGENASKKMAVVKDLDFQGRLDQKSLLDPGKTSMLGSGKGLDVGNKDAKLASKSMKKEEKMAIGEKNNIEVLESKTSSLKSNSINIQEKSKSQSIHSQKQEVEGRELFNKTLPFMNIDQMDHFINTNNKQSFGQCKFKETLEKALAFDRGLLEERIEEVTTSGNDEYIQGLNYHEFLKENFMDKDFGDMLNSLNLRKEDEPSWCLDDFENDLNLNEQRWVSKARLDNDTIPVDEFLSRESELIEDLGSICSTNEEVKQVDKKGKSKKEKPSKSEFASKNSLLSSFQISSVLDFIFKKKQISRKATNKNDTKNVNKQSQGKLKSGKRNKLESDESSEWDENEMYKPLKPKRIAHKEKKIKKTELTVENKKNLENVQNEAAAERETNIDKKKIFIIVRDKKPHGKNIQNLRKIDVIDFEEIEKCNEKSDSEDMEEIVKRVKKDDYFEEDHIQINVEEIDFDEISKPKKRRFGKKIKDKDEDFENQLKGRFASLRKTFSSTNKETPRRSAREKRKLEVEEENEKGSDFMFVDFKQHRIQPLKITISLKALIMMNLHAHLSKLEVIGLLGGRVISEEEIVIEEALTCRNILECSNGHSVEMDPASQVETQEELEKMGYKNIGWYHSHPVFKTTPSQIDQETHLNHQICYKDHPYIGMIVAPYFINKLSLKNKGEIFVFHVVKNQTYKLNFSVKPVSHLTIQDLQSIEKLITEYHNSHKGIVFNGTWKKDLTYKGKIIGGLTTLLEENLALLELDQQQSIAKRISMEIEDLDNLQKEKNSDESDSAIRMDYLDSTSVESPYDINPANSDELVQETDKFALQSKQSVERILDFIKGLLKDEQAQSETIL